MIKLSNIESKWHGLVPYQEALVLQDLASQQVRKTTQGVILGLEHPSVITLGKRGNLTSDLNNPSPFPVVNIDRGGQATLHSPGQLVIYPILPLAALGISVREYILRMEQVTIAVLGGIGIAAYTSDQPGVHTANGKIGFIGVRVEQGVSRHGISINVSNNLEYFSLIRSCGVSAAKIDQIKNYNDQIKLEDLFQSWVQRWSEISQ